MFAQASEESIIFEQLLKTKPNKRKGNLYYGHGNQQ